MKTSYTIGINFLHSDTSACIFKNNKLIAAYEEERFTRVKHTSFFPTNAIKHCLNEAQIHLSDVDYITINSNPFSSLIKKIGFIISNPFSLGIVFQSIKNTKNKISLKKKIFKIDPINRFKGKIKFIDHHESHIASSMFSSNFKDSVNLSLDGFGDFASCAWGLRYQDNLKLDNKIYFPHSLGIFYQSLTQFLGFKSYGDEYKVMGLSPYGKPKFYNEISELIKKNNKGFKLNLDYFRHHKQKIFHISENGQFVYENLYSKKLLDLLGKNRNPHEKIEQRHMDLAKSIQAVYEDVFFHILNLLNKKYKNVQNLTLSGGCAMNSVANGKILSNTKFKNIYINPNPGDAGGSVGSSLSFLKKKFNYEFDVKNYSYLGNSFTNNEISKILDEEKISSEFNQEYLENNKLYPYITNHLVKGNVIGLFQGRMEWGPRALGNRSIIADARNPKIKDIINNKIKRRESFRPFAPSILEEYVGDWFEEKNKVPYMSEVYKIKQEKQKIIPGVTHVDGTGRLQTVNKNDNEKYYNLIKNFFENTNVPIILNTSFNENEPIVNKPIEAINCFKRTKMDVLVLENWVISRNQE